MGAIKEAESLKTTRRERERDLYFCTDNQLGTKGLSFLLPLDILFARQRHMSPKRVQMGHEDDGEHRSKAAKRKKGNKDEEKGGVGRRRRRICGAA